MKGHPSRARDPNQKTVIRIVLWTGGVLAILTGFLISFQPALVDYLDNRFYDALVRIQPDIPANDNVIIVDIDEQSLMAAGQWPWPRYRIAALVKELTRAGSSVIAFDAAFPEADRTSLSTIKETFQREFSLDIGFTGLPPGLDDNDGYLGLVLEKTKSIGAIYFHFNLLNADPTCGLAPLDISMEANRMNFPEATGILCNNPKVQEGFSGFGFINADNDEDGVLRRMLTVISFQNKLYPSLPLATFMSAGNLKSARIEESFFGPILLVGQARIPVDQKGNALLRFEKGERGHRFISAIDILTGKYDQTRLTGKTVIVGTTAMGLNDMHHTPLGPKFSGAETHLLFLKNAFSNTFNRQPVWKEKYTLVSTLLVCIVIPLIFAFAGPFFAAAGTTGVSLAFLGISCALFFRQGVFLPVTGPVMAAITQIATLALVLYAFQKRLAFIRLRKLVRVQQLTLESMAAVAETRDIECGSHIKRTQHYVKAIADYLAGAGDYPVLSPDYCELLYHSAPLHDIGKVGIPDKVLFNTGTLTVKEFEIMQLHTKYGRHVVDAAGMGGEEHEFLQLAGEIAYTHHERWDGAGYPSGLKGEEIPLSGRIMAVADVYDALVTHRRYKTALSHLEAREIIIANRGKQFDPAIVDAFIAVEDEFIEIAQKFQNEEESGKEYL
ncbi:MAG: CHASE2 domain-containing protein [Deltaproteobacteria bacterium]|nr:CHASE2 domain-containing protein [Deltaproteobacteria bacterium]